MPVAVSKIGRDVVAAGLSEQQLPGEAGHLLHTNVCEIVIREPDSVLQARLHVNESERVRRAINFDGLGRLATPNR